LAARQPLVLVLDDIHWADEASLELIVHLLRRPAPARILTALAFREGQLPVSVLAALEASAREHSVSELRLSPLSAAEADVVMGEHVPAAVREEVYRQRGGNPSPRDRSRRRDGSQSRPPRNAPALRFSPPRTYRGHSAPRPPSRLAAGGYSSRS
jgi:hypothetical protein